MNTAIIVAAGTGSRFDSETPKQFLEILGKPLIGHTLDRFERCEAIGEIVLVLAENQIAAFERLDLRKVGSKLSNVVPGGRTRAASVSNGLAAVRDSVEVVAVHDGARPMVTPVEIARTIERAAEVGAACLVAPIIDTIKHVERGIVTGTLDRSRLRRALTPQAFRYDVLTKAFEGAELSAEVTDECYLVEKLGVPIAVVEGSTRNIKITHPQDLAIAALYLKQELFD